MLQFDINIRVSKNNPLNTHMMIILDTETEQREVNTSVAESLAVYPVDVALETTHRIVITHKRHYTAG